MFLFREFIFTRRLVGPSKKPQWSSQKIWRISGKFSIKFGNDHFRKLQSQNLYRLANSYDYQTTKFQQNSKKLKRIFDTFSRKFRKDNLQNNDRLLNEDNSYFHRIHIWYQTLNTFQEIAAEFTKPQIILGSSIEWTIFRTVTQFK